MNDKYGFVYIWRDRKHKRYYIGCHWGHINDGYVCSSSWMKKAYKLRPDDFKRRIIKSDIVVRSEMYVEEEKWLRLIKKEEIKPLNPKPRYYNLKTNNSTVWHAYDESIKTVGQKISAAKTGRKVKPFTEERCANISKAKKGKKFSAEHIAKLSEARRGKTRSEEAKRKTSESLRRAYAEGRKVQLMTEETRAKISATKRSKSIIK